MKIVLDAMGGDDAPNAIVQGAIAAQKDFEDCELILVGKQEEIQAAFQKNNCNTLPERISIVDAREVIEMTDDPTYAFRRKKDSSMTVGLNLLKSGNGDAFISAGSSGALISAATLMIHRCKGIRRAAVAPVVPAINGNYVLIDGGTNAECTPEYLVQFAYMGSFYAQYLMGKENPTVGLLNIGSEPGKGDPLHQEAYKELAEIGKRGDINFVGNVESREASYGNVDVVVADGFSGNIYLKAVEGISSCFSEELKKIYMHSPASQLGYLFAKGGLDNLKKLLDYREVGGSCILGVQKPVLKAHGSSDEKAIYGAIRQARTAVSSGVCNIIADQALKLLQEKQEKKG